MKTISSVLIFVFLITHCNLNSQDVTTFEVIDNDLSENLDLEAVASLFGEAGSLEDFEYRLNDPETQISNLDLNEDGEIDYLRIIETSNGNTHLIIIQAVLGQNQYQDVATIDVDNDNNGETFVQVVGNATIYGPHYIIEPVYVYTPKIIVGFRRPNYQPWHSPYFWGHYPAHFHTVNSYPVHIYHRRVAKNINVRNSYHRTSIRKSNSATILYKNHRHNAYGAKHPHNQSQPKMNTSMSGNPKNDKKRVKSDGANKSEGKSKTNKRY